MPEIAEVEVSRRACDRLIGSNLTGVEIYDNKIDDDFLPLIGKKLIAVERVGKRLGFIFDGDQALVVHLRMTGRLFFGRHEKARVLIRFDNDEVSFIDSRRFGTLTRTEASDLDNNLGPDLFNDWPVKIEASRSARAIKNVILDQTVIAGIGNYLADESLWMAQINPARPASLLSKAEWKKLLTAAHQTALTALDGGGLSMRDYLGPDGQAGAMEGSLKCYGQAGNPCARCSTPLIKIKLSGRGTTYCPNCQKR